MKKILIGVGIVVVLLVIAAIAVPALIPVDTYRSQLVSRIEAATGREARIDGDFKLSLLPRLEFVAGKVSLANASGESPPQMVMLDKLTVRIAMIPLLRGNVEIDSFVLDKPVIALSVDKSGRPNWQFATASAAPEARPAAGQPAPGPAQTPAGSSGSRSRLADLSLGDVRINDGQVSYADARSGARYEADAITMKVSLPSLSSPMKADGSVVWNKEKVSLTLNVAEPNALLEGKPTAIDANIAGNPLTFTFKGRAANGKILEASGALDLNVPSVRNLAAWAGKPLTAPGSGYGPLKISGNVAVAGPKVDFTEASLGLDDIHGTGDVRFDGSGKRPYVNARLNLGKLDANPYLPPQAGNAGKGAPVAPAKPAPAAGQSSDWSDDPIDLSGLHAADADVDLAVDSLIFRKIKVEKSHLAVALKDGKLTADLSDMALYQGHGKGKVIADASQSLPAIGLDFNLAGLQAHPFLVDAMDMDSLEGTANATMNVTSHGASQRAIVSALNGTGKVDFRNGAIRGADLGAMARNVESAFGDHQARQQQKTEFGELSGTFTIRNGILTNNDMALQSPVLGASGKGTVDLPKRTVDYRIDPKGVVGALVVPILVHGPWDNLSYRPDLSGIADIAKNAPSAEGIKKMIPGIPGGGTSSPQLGQAPAAQPPGAPSKSSDPLKKLFGK